jgi:hypothetical protein
VWRNYICPCFPMTYTDHGESLDRSRVCKRTFLFLALITAPRRWRFPRSSPFQTYPMSRTRTLPMRSSNPTISLRRPCVALHIPDFSLEFPTNGPIIIIQILDSDNIASFEGHFVCETRDITPEGNDVGLALDNVGGIMVGDFGYGGCFRDVAGGST